MSKRTTVVLPDGVDDVVEAVVSASAASPDVPLLSQSDVIRLLMRDATDRLVEGDLTVEENTREVTGITGETLADLVPDHKRARYYYSERKEINWLNDMREGFEKRVRDRLEKRFGNGYTPEGAEAVAEEYIGEAFDLWVRVGDDRETFEAKREWVLDRLDVYREKYEATSYDPDEEFLAGWSGVEDGEATDEFADVEGMVRAVAEDRYRNGSPSPSALAESISFAFDADEELVREVVDEVRRESVVEDQTRASEDDGHDALSADARAALGTAETVEDAVETVAAHGKAVDCNREESEDLDGVVLDEAEAAELVAAHGEVETDGGEVDEGDGPRTDGGVNRRPGGRSPGQEGYWNELAAEADAARDRATDGGDVQDDGDGADDRESVTVRERLAEEFDGRIHGVAVTAKRGDTYYAVVSHDAEGRGGDVVRLTTAVVDLGEGKVRASENSLWVPREGDTLDAMTRLLARTTSDVSTDDDETPPVEAGVDEVDVDDLLSTPLAPDEYEPPADGWGVTWGNGKGAPPQIHDLVSRLDEAGVPTDRFTKLVFGEKGPFNARYENLSADEFLPGNYGVEVGVPSSTEDVGADDRVLENDSLVVLDVDYPEDAPLDRLPETFRVSSANGSDDRAHHYLVVDDLDAVVEHFGRGAVKPAWGDCWLYGEYVVGPGCYDSESGGRYEVVSDAPLAEVSAEWLIELLSDGLVEEDDEDDEVVESDPSEFVDRVPTHPNGEGDSTEDVDGPTCADCGEAVDPAEADLTDRGDGPVYVCGCGGDSQ